MKTKHTPKAPPVVSTVANPFALVTRNGASPGKRPNTFLAYIVGTIQRGRYAGWSRAYIGRNGGADWTGDPQPVCPDDIRARWRAFPSPESVERERRKLPVYELPAKGA